jgi:hypothetical protein
MIYETGAMPQKWIALTWFVFPPGRIIAASARRIPSLDLGAKGTDLNSRTC